MKVVTERDIDINNIIEMLNKSINKVTDEKRLFTVSVNKQLLIDCRDLLTALNKGESNE